MDWNKLLCEDRVRELMGGPASRRGPGDRRTEFDRDFDRAIFSTPVRRLQDKTQVFPMDPNDSVRTRLTHSLEVSSVARGIAGAIGKWLSETGKFDGRLAKEPERAIRAIEAIAATCGLIHDLGNPPFGHAGEQAIRTWFEGKVRQDAQFLAFEGRRDAEQLGKDFLLFEGNAQTLRLIAKLQILADKHGLNLTCGTLSAACKYIPPADKADRDHANRPRRKPGHFASETDLVARVREQVGTGDARNPITFLVEAADDAVYATVDLEDGVRKGVLHWRTIKKRLSERTGEPEGRLLHESLASAEAQVAAGREQMLLSGRGEDEALVQAFRVAAILHIVVAVVKAFKEHYDEIMAGTYQNELVQDSDVATLVKDCKVLGQKFVYRSTETLRLEVQGRRVIHDLMDVFWEGAESGEPEGQSFPDKIAALLSSNYRTICRLATQEGKFPEKYCKLQLLTDYVCGMTDSFACSLHRKLMNG